MPELNPEQRVRQQIDKQLRTCGWIIQDDNATSEESLELRDRISPPQQPITQSSGFLFTLRRPRHLLQPKEPQLPQGFRSV